MEVGKITLACRGKEYTATIDRITAHAADPRSPWEKEDSLQVWLSFEKDEGKYPGSTLGFVVALPVKQYYLDELIKLVKVEAERRLEEFQVADDKNRAIRESINAEQEELDKLAASLSLSWSHKR